MLDQNWNIVKNKLFLTFNLILKLKTKKCIVLQKSATTNPNHINLVWFSSIFILKINRTKPNVFLSRGSDNFWP